MGSIPLDLASHPGGGAPPDAGSAAPHAELWCPAAARHGSRPWPVLVYFSGWEGIRIDSMAAIDALVAHGFAVVTVTYPAELRRPMDFSSGAAFQDTIRRATDRVRGRARDAVRVLDTLTGAAGRPGLGRLVPRMDCDKVGIFGYSFGGAVAAQAAWMDCRFKAVANLDGWQFAEAAEHGITQPFLLMSDGTPLPTDVQLQSSNEITRNVAILTDRDYRRAVANLSRHGGVYAALAGTTHGSIAGARPRWQRRWLTQLGLIRPRRTLQILSTCVREFFEQHLELRADQPVGAWATRFPELQVRIYPRPGLPQPLAAGALQR